MAINVTVQDADDGIDVTVSGGADTRVNVSDDGAEVVAAPTDINFGTNLGVTDDGDRSVTVNASGGGGGGGAAVYASAYSGATGGAKIQAAIDDENTRAGPNIVIVDGEGPDDVSGSTGAIGDAALSQHAWKLTQHLSVPSNTYLIFRGCYVFLGDATDDNLIRNSDFTNGNTRINIIGDGDAILDGNGQNQTTYDRATSDSLVNIGLRFFKTDDLTVRGLTIRETNAWALKSEGGDSVHVHEIRFDQSGNTPNQDGVDIVGPATNISVSDINGRTGDDMVASRCHGQSPLNEGAGGDVQNITIENVAATVLETGDGVRVHRGDLAGMEMSGVTISNVSADGVGLVAGVNIGFEPGNRKELRDINVSNVHATGARGVYITGACREVNLRNISCHNAGNAIHVSEGFGPATISGVASFGCSSTVYFSDNGTNLTMSDIVASSDGATDSAIKVGSGVTLRDSSITNLSLLLRDANLNPNGSGIRVLGSAADITISDVTARKVATLFDIEGTATGTVNNVDVNGAGVTTVYGGIDQLRFGGDVPPIASGTMVLTGGTAGAQSTTVDGALADQLREPVVRMWVDSDPAFAANYGWRMLPPDRLWDDTQGAIDVSPRAEWSTDPGAGNDVTLAYEVLPGKV